MIISKERKLKSEFIRVRDRIASECSLDLESKLELHIDLLNACLQEIECGTKSPYTGFSHGKGISVVPEKMRERIDSLLEMASDFREHPSVITSMFEMKPEIKTEREKQGKYGERHGERRMSGRFYTPLAMARFMAEILISEYFEDGNKTKDLKILDPSVGCGIFPDVMYSELERKGIRSGKILKSLYGVDCDAEVLELTKSAVRIKSNGQAIESKQLIKGDFLLDELEHPDGGYDLIIGNPPYIAYYSRESQANSERVKSDLVKRYGNFGGGSANTFLYFIVRGIELLKNEGMLCFIVPDKLLWNRRYGRIRKYILETASPRVLYTAGENVFPGATVGNVIVILQKGVTNKKCSVGSLKAVSKGDSFDVAKRKKVDIKE
ncbi:MAG: N-6 DNA methylase, partial [bacterium]